MAKMMKRIAVISVLLMFVFCFICKITNNRFLVPFIITFGTIAYHFIIRLMVGTVVDCMFVCMQRFNRARMVKIKVK